MELLLNKFYYLTLQRKQELLEINANSLGTLGEKAIRIEVGGEDFKVRTAETQAYRIHGDKPRSLRRIEGMEGLSLYLDGGKRLREILAAEEITDWEDLFLDAMRGVIQSEFLVSDRRGFSSKEDYEYYFHQNFIDTCVYYARPPEKSLHWYTYVADQNRGNCFFTRYRFNALYRKEDAGYFLRGTMIDSFHEMNVEIDITSEAEIKDCSAAILRCPDEVCRESEQNFTRLNGNNLLQTSKGDLARCAGGPKGCSHLVDIVFDLRTLFQEAEANLLLRDND